MVTRSLRAHRGRVRIVLVALSLVLVVLACPSAAAEPTEPAAPVGVWPLRPDPVVVNDFDPPASRYGAGHRGVDLAATIGQSVHAALPGTVTFAGRVAGKGVVVVGHGETRTTYEPVAAAVAVGDPVAAGAVIGVVEYAGSHCRPRACLHWGWLRGETYLDPLLLVGAGPVRLVPLEGLRGSPAATARRPRPSAPHSVLLR